MLKPNYILQNLNSLNTNGEPLDFNWCHIRMADPRLFVGPVRNYNHQNEWDGVDELCDRFYDETHTKYTPCIIASRTPNLLSREAIVAFRNCIALLCCFQGRYIATTAQIQGVGRVGFTDHFQISAAIPVDKSHYHLITPTRTNVLSPTNQFHGHCSSFIGSPCDYTCYDNEYLNAVLRGFWEMVYIDNDNEDVGRRIFRSLHACYLAMNTPSPSIPSGQDYGFKASMLVAAFEILFHSDNESIHINQFHTINFINAMTWDGIISHKRYVWNGRNGKSRVSFVEIVMRNIYRARNNHMHGNHIVNEGVLFRRYRGAPLYVLAFVIYVECLVQFLFTNGFVKQDYIQQPGVLWSDLPQTLLEEHLQRYRESQA